MASDINFTVSESSSDVVFLAENVPAGTYPVSIFYGSDKACEYSTEFTVENRPQPEVELVSVKDVSCSGQDDGEVVILVRGGADISFPGSDEVERQSDSRFLVTYRDLKQDDIDIRLVYENGICTFDTSFSVGLRPVPAIETAVENASCSLVSDGSITFTLEGNVEEFDFQIDPIPVMTIGPGAQDGENAIFVQSGLTAGSYAVSVTYGSGAECVTMTTVDVDLAPPGSVLQLETEIVPADCFGESNGAIIPSAEGETGDIDFTVVNIATQEEVTDLDALPFGSYNISATDENGCSDAILRLVGQPDTLVIAAIDSTDDTSGGNAPANGSVVFEVTGGNGDYSYTWLMGGQAFSPDPARIDTVTIERNGLPTVGRRLTLSGLPKGVYQLNVIDPKGCEAMSATVELDGEEGGGMLQGRMTDQDRISVFNNRLTLYPNPVGDRLYIRVETKLPEYLEIRVLNLQGQFLTGKVIDDSFGSYDIDLAHLPRGKYVIQLRWDDKVENRKIVLQ